MGFTNEDNLGDINISEEVLAACVMTAVLRTKGVHSLYGGLARNLLNKDPMYKGLKLNVTDEGVVVDIHVIVEYGVRIPGVAWDIQENVKAEIESVTGMGVHAINIHVQGVHFDEEKE